MSYIKAVLIVLILLVVVGLLFGHYDCNSISVGVALCTGVGVIGLLTGTLIYQVMKLSVRSKALLKPFSAVVALFACALLLYHLVWIIMLYIGYAEQHRGRDLAFLGVYFTLCTIACPVAVIFGYGAGQSSP